VTTATRRGRFQGVLQILRFNWPMYAAAAVGLGGGAAGVAFLPLPSFVRTAVLIGIAAAGFWLLVSLAVSHYVYDRAGLYDGEWLARAVRQPPRGYANLHAGFDEFSTVLEARFPDTERVVLDFFDARTMTEPSIVRARALATSQPPAQQVDFAALPLKDRELDAAFLIFAAHELREHSARAQLLRELHRALRRDGSVVLVEHLRDAANFLAFGPGFLHFHSRAQWLRGITEAGFHVADEFPLTAFVRVFVLQKATVESNQPAVAI
jgi:SAM-dependent methyltransferase